MEFDFWVKQFQILSLSLDIWISFASFPLLSSVPPDITQILAKNSLLCTFLFDCYHLFFFLFLLFSNSEETILGEIPLNEPVT